jgi:hypothetical protein
MASKAGTDMEYQFDPGSLDLAQVQRLAEDMWSDLAFDDAALARLKRDGLVLDGVRLTGPIPYQLAQDENCSIRVSAGDHPHAAILLDLWQLHFVKGLRLGSIAA